MRLEELGVGKEFIVADAYEGLLIGGFCECIGESISMVVVWEVFNRAVVLGESGKVEIKLVVDVG